MSRSRSCRGVQGREKSASGQEERTLFEKMSSNVPEKIMEPVCLLLAKIVEMFGGKMKENHKATRAHRAHLHTLEINHMNVPPLFP